MRETKRVIWIMLLVVVFFVGGSGIAVAGGKVAEKVAPGKPVSVVRAEPETVAVATNGVLYLFGNRLEPPYVFTMLEDTVWVNDYFMMWDRRHEWLIKSVPETTRMQHNLLESLWVEMERLDGLGVGLDSMMARAVEIFSGSDLVDSVEAVKVVPPGEYEVLVWWKGRRKDWGAEHVSIHHFEPREEKPDKERRIDAFRQEAQRIAEYLNDGWIVIDSGGYVCSRHVSEYEERIARIRERGYATEDEKPGFTLDTLRDIINPKKLVRRGERR